MLSQFLIAIISAVLGAIIPVIWAVFEHSRRLKENQIDSKINQGDERVSDELKMIDGRHTQNYKEIRFELDEVKKQNRSDTEDLRLLVKEQAESCMRAITKTTENIDKLREVVTELSVSTAKLDANQKVVFKKLDL